MIVRWLKRLCVVAGILLVSYLIAVGLFYWNWMMPHEKLPEGREQYGEQILINPEYQDLANSVDNLIKEKTKSLSVPSLSASFAIDNELVWSGTSGLANIEQRIPATISSQYRSGSVSKSLTSLVVARLLDQGKFKVDLPINNYLRDYPKGDVITSRMLGNHTAGIRHYKYSLAIWPPSEFLLDEEFDSVEESLEVFKEDDLLFKPGTNFSYSSYGYNLLSFILEEVSDTPFLELIQKEVFDPLQMSNTRADKAGIKNDQRVNFYNTKPNYYGQAYPVNLSGKWAGGGFLSTSTDLVKAGLSVINDNYISDEARIILFTPPNKNGEGPCGYGFGWAVCKYPVLVGSDEPITTYSHGGSSEGGVSFLMVIPEEGVVIAIHSNTTLSGGSNNMRLIVEEIASMILVSKR